MPRLDDSKAAKLLAVFVAVLAVFSFAHADTIYVDDDAPPGGDGESWASAYRFLQDALTDAAVPGGAITEIRVAQGRYQPDRTETDPGGTGSPEDAFWLIDGLALRGAYAGLGAADPDARNLELFATILTGELLDYTDPTSCCLAHGEPGCTDTACAQLVCELLPSCCDTAWEEICLELADFLPCDGLVCPDPIPVHHVLRSQNIDHPIVLDGLTVTGGVTAGSDNESGAGLYNDRSTVTISDCTFHTNVAAGPGGAIANYASVVEIYDSVFINNSASESGGGVHNALSNVVIVNSVFTGNTVQFAFFNKGGGIYSIDSTLSLIDCTFSENEALWPHAEGGAVHNRDTDADIQGCTFVDNMTYSASRGGAAIYNDRSDPTIVACSFTGNVADGASGTGGAVLNNTGSDPLLIGCTFFENEAIGNTGFGGAIASFSGSSPLAVNCLFQDNFALEDGGAVFGVGAPTYVNCLFTGNRASRGGAVTSWYFTYPLFVNCTVADNEAISGTGGGFFGRESASPHLVNCIIWGNTPNSVSDDATSGTTLSFCDVEGGFPGTGNINADPFFVDPGTGDYRLQAGSPCIDAGHNNAIAGLTDTDLDGNPRFADDPATDDTGCGVPVVVDMGAYEFQGTPFDVKFADLDGNGAVDVVDFFDLIAAWGPCTKQCCLADLDLDGDVTTTDFFLLLANWGP